MPDTNRKLTRWSITRIGAGLAALAMVLSALAGCATDGNGVKTAPVAMAIEPALDQTVSVDRLADGREGFIITEFPQLDDASRQEFVSAVVMLTDGDYGPAIELLEAVIQRSPGVTAPYINLGIAYRRIDKPEQAEAHLKTALQLVPGHPVAANECGLLYRKKGQFEEARKVYEQAVQGFPEYYPVHRNLGILCDLYLNDPACALAHYEIYSQTMPEDTQVKLWIADLRARLGNN